MPLLQTVPAQVHWHVPASACWQQVQAAQPKPSIPDFPPELKTLVEHLIISHHGEYEFGSPKLPMFAEALLLHYMDDLDSKLESMRAHFEREAGAESSWAGYNPSLGRPLLNSAKFLEKRPVSVATIASAEANSDSQPPQPKLDLIQEKSEAATTATGKV